MALRAIFADRLPFALPHPKHVDEARADDEPDDERGHQRRPGAERLITHEVEDAFEIQPFGEEV